jgi:hypothetical protein
MIFNFLTHFIRRIRLLPEAAVNIRFSNKLLFTSLYALEGDCDIRFLLICLYEIESPRLRSHDIVGFCFFSSISLESTLLYHRCLNYYYLLTRCFLKKVNKTRGKE